MRVNGSRLTNGIEKLRRRTTLWYEKRATRVIFFLGFTVIFTLTIFYVPYFNLLIPSGKTFFIVLLAWYLLFPPRTRTIVLLSLFILFFCFLFSLVELTILAEGLGDALFFLLVMILVNIVRKH